MLGNLRQSRRDAAGLGAQIEESGPGLRCDADGNYYFVSDKRPRRGNHWAQGLDLERNPGAHGYQMRRRIYSNPPRRAARDGLVDLGRIEELLTRIGGRIRHVRRDRITPLAVPLILEVGKEPIYGGAAEELLLQQAAEDLLYDATRMNSSAAQ